MLKKLHKNYNDGHLTLRDYLAAHRTIMANDRTWLSYVRTSLTLFVVGVTFIKFFDSAILFMIGWIFVPIGIAVLMYGFTKFLHVKKLIHSIRQTEKDIKKI